jgi:hypothetical protein
MNIIVHYPKSDQDRIYLQKKVATIHAEAVLRHIAKLSCHKEQRCKLIEEIEQAYPKR